MTTFKDLWSHITYPVRLLRARINYDRAVLTAEEMCQKQQQRQYIIKGAGKKLLICDRKNFRLLKHKGYINKQASIKDLEKACLYCTAYPNGSDPLPKQALDIKRKAAIYWLTN